MSATSRQKAVFGFVFAAATLITLHVLASHLALETANIDLAEISDGNTVPIDLVGEDPAIYALR